MITYAFGITLPLGLAILVSSFLIFPLRYIYIIIDHDYNDNQKNEHPPISERATSAKQVQIMTGLHPATFWASNLLWDLLLFILSSFAMLGLILILDQHSTFLTYHAWAALLLIMVLEIRIAGMSDTSLSRCYWVCVAPLSPMSSASSPTTRRLGASSSSSPFTVNCEHDNMIMIGLPS